MEPGQEFDLRFEKDKAYLSETKYLHFSSVVGLPEFVISFPEPATWRLRVLRHDRPSGTIYVEMGKCHNGRFDFSPEQSSDESLDQVRKIHLNKLDRHGFLQTYDINHGASEYQHPEKAKNGEKTYPNYPLYRPTPKPIYDSFFVPIKNLTLIDGGVRFTRKIKGVNQELEITIYNEAIKKEFNAVKNYFANVLQTKKIYVEVALEVLEGSVTKETIRSREIEQIDANTVERVQAEFVGGIINLRREVDSEHTLFTLEELMNTITGEDINSGIFHEEAKELMEDAIKQVRTKHHNHLGFLSRRHLHQLTKLRLVLKPFSYVFLLEGTKHYHLIWETHNTEEATYVWSVSKNPEELAEHLAWVGRTISMLKANNKNDYVRSAPDGFSRVIHDYSDPVAGFKKWKADIEELLT